MLQFNTKSMPLCETKSLQPKHVDISSAYSQSSSRAFKPLAGFNQVGVEIIHTIGTLTAENFESRPETVEIFDRAAGPLPTWPPANIEVLQLMEIRMHGQAKGPQCC